jgi:AcrR family transcriptional regulator
VSQRTDSPKSPAAAPRRRISAEERRELILAAALEIFAERGYHGSSIDEIAHAAGVSKALIYEHFPSKRDLHISLLEQHIQEIFERLASAAATSDPGEVRLEAGVNAFLEFVESRRDAFRMLFRDAVESDVAEMLMRVQQQVGAAVAGLIASEPREERGDPEASRQAVQSLALWWGDHEEVPRQQLVRVVMDFAWLGLERLRAGERWTVRDQSA